MDFWQSRSRFKERTASRRSRSARRMLCISGIPLQWATLAPTWKSHLPFCRGWRHMRIIFGSPSAVGVNSNSLKSARGADRRLRNIPRFAAHEYIYTWLALPASPTTVVGFRQSLGVLHQDYFSRDHLRLAFQGTAAQARQSWLNIILRFTEIIIIWAMYMFRISAYEIRSVSGQCFNKKTLVESALLTRDACSNASVDNDLFRPQTVDLGNQNRPRCRGPGCSPKLQNPQVVFWA